MDKTPNLGLTVEQWLEYLPAHMREKSKKYFLKNPHYEVFKNVIVDSVKKALVIAIHNLDETDEGSQWWWHNYDYLGLPQTYDIRPAGRVKQQQETIKN